MAPNEPNPTDSTEPQPRPTEDGMPIIPGVTGYADRLQSIINDMRAALELEGWESDLPESDHEQQ